MYIERVAAAGRTPTGRAAPGVDDWPPCRGRHQRRRGVVALGPAFVAAIAYIDPGNFATNTVAGADRGYELMWVVVLASATAVLVQYLAAKLGIATGQSLPELCGHQLSRSVAAVLWLQAEVVVMATDLAEILGGALALWILFGLPLPVGGAVTAAVAFVLLAAQRHGHRPFEALITALLAVVVVAFVFQAVLSGVSVGKAATAVVVPRLKGSQDLLLAAGIFGATVMPHVIYLHSAMTARRMPRQRTWQRTLLRAQRTDLGLALGAAGFVNVALLAVAAAAFASAPGMGQTLPEAFHGFRRLLGPGVATAFAGALLASGLAASSVGTYAGQVVMEGFIGRRVPLWLRRGVTVAPALLLLSLGIDPTRALVLSQVVLSFGIPFAVVPLLWFTARRDVMGGLVNRRVTTTIALLVVVAVVAGNALLLAGA